MQGVAFEAGLVQRILDDVGTEPGNLPLLEFALSMLWDQRTNGLITNEKTIERKPELVRSVVRAVLRGLRDTLQDPDEAFAICRRYVQEIDDESAPLQRAVLEEALNFWRADDLGRSDPAAWEASQTFMRQIELIESEVDASSLFTNDFVQEP